MFNIIFCSKTLTFSKLQVNQKVTSFFFSHLLHHKAAQLRLSAGLRRTSQPNPIEHNSDVDDDLNASEATDSDMRTNPRPLTPVFWSPDQMRDFVRQRSKSSHIARPRAEAGCSRRGCTQGQHADDSDDEEWLTSRRQVRSSTTSPKKREPNPRKYSPLVIDSDTSQEIERYNARAVENGEASSSESDDVIHYPDDGRIVTSRRRTPIRQHSSPELSPSPRSAHHNYYRAHHRAHRPGRSSPRRGHALLVLELPGGRSGRAGAGAPRRSASFHQTHPARPQLSPARHRLLHHAPF